MNITPVSIAVCNQKGGVDCRLPLREYVPGHGMELLGLGDACCEAVAVRAAEYRLFRR